MRVTLVGHASVLVEAGPLRLLSDPWLVGMAFNDAWAIHPEPAWAPSDVARATHLWISHEHPDHLSIPTLRAIPAEVRAGLTVLFQRTWSSEVVDHLRGQGFGEVVELDHGVRHPLPGGVAVTCWQVGHQDSALVVEHDGRRLLNLNDCKPSDAGLRRLASLGPFDLLLDQFSIAGWAGNAGDHTALAAARRGAVDVLCRHARALQPAATIPFASFMRFCHVENAHLDPACVELADVDARWDREAAGELVLLHHGDDWELGAPSPDRAAAVQRHRELAAARADLPRLTSPSKALDEVRTAMDTRMQAWREAFGTALLGRLVEPVRFHLDDLGEDLVVDPLDRRDPRTTVRTSSQAAWFAGHHRFGVETLLISGRFQLEGDPEGWRRFKRIGGAHAAGIHPRDVVRAATTARGRAFAGRRWRHAVDDLVRRG